MKLYNLYLTEIFNQPVKFKYDKHDRYGFSYSFNVNGAVYNLQCLAETPHITSNRRFEAVLSVEMTDDDLPAYETQKDTKNAFAVYATVGAILKDSVKKGILQEEDVIYFRGYDSGQRKAYPAIVEYFRRILKFDCTYDSIEGVFELTIQ